MTKHRRKILWRFCGGRATRLAKLRLGPLLDSYSQIVRFHAVATFGNRQQEGVQSFPPSPLTILVEFCKLERCLTLHQF